MNQDLNKALILNQSDTTIMVFSVSALMFLDKCFISE